MKHSTVPVPALPVPSNEIAGSSRTTLNVLATSSPIKAKKRENLIFLGGVLQKLKKQKLKVRNRPIHKLICVKEPITYYNLDNFSIAVYTMLCYAKFITS